MNQTKILLENAREDWCAALNVLALISIGMLPATTENVMYAYMVARDWMEWIKNPNSSEENPLFGKNADHTPLLEDFQTHVENLEIVLLENEGVVEVVFQTLTPSLHQLLSSKNPTLKKETEMFHRSLRLTAKLFEEKFGISRFNEILDDRQVPQIA